MTLKITEPSVQHLLLFTINQQPNNSAKFWATNKITLVEKKRWRRWEDNWTKKHIKTSWNTKMSSTESKITIATERIITDLRFDKWWKHPNPDCEHHENQKQNSRQWNFGNQQLNKNLQAPRLKYTVPEDNILPKFHPSTPKLT